MPRKSSDHDLAKLVCQFFLPSQSSSTPWPDVKHMHPDYKVPNIKSFSFRGLLNIVGWCSWQTYLHFYQKDSQSISSSSYHIGTSPHWSQTTKNLHTAPKTVLTTAYNDWLDVVLLVSQPRQGKFSVRSLTWYHCKRQHRVVWSGYFLLCLFVRGLQITSESLWDGKRPPESQYLLICWSAAFFNLTPNLFSLKI